MAPRLVLALAAAAALGFTLSAAIAVAAIGDAAAGSTELDTMTRLPTHLRDTGLHADGSTSAAHAALVAFSPQYPLWSDGTSKRRWIRLPSGKAIDASRPDAFEFPPGTRLWKEFGYDRPVETRLIERLADGSWRYATYIWNAEGTDAVLAPADGATLSVAKAPGGRYVVPSQADCVACHEGASVPVLGFTALQLSPDRDPLAPHAKRRRHDESDLRDLVSRGLIRNLPRHLLDEPPRIAAPTPTARAALGYLHGNCGHCHNESGAVAGIDLVLAQQVADPVASAARALQSMIGHTSRFRVSSAETAQRLVPGSADGSVIAARMRSSNRLTRMPPLGAELIDDEGLALIERWITHHLQHETETR